MVFGIFFSVVLFQRFFTLFVVVEPSPTAIIARRIAHNWCPVNSILAMGMEFTESDAGKLLILSIYYIIEHSAVFYSFDSAGIQACVSATLSTTLCLTTSSETSDKSLNSIGVSSNVLA